MKNILFYKYTNVNRLKKLQEELLSKSKSLGLLGKILIAKEGVNGCVSGKDEDIKKIKDYITLKFGKVEFKESKVLKHTFKKMFVRIRDEIISTHYKSNLENKAEYIEPKELKKLLDSKDEVIMVDARNAYESEIGRFENAITPKIDVFSEWPKAVSKLGKNKEKLIVTYCTGGVRCEKASAYMVEQGFTNVKQLHGGIIRYGKTVGVDHWEGKCFVFDHRGAVSINEEEPKLISQCAICHIPSDNQENCAKVECDKFFVVCEKCYAKFDNCCSRRCKNEIQRIEIK
ncbi:hypothetical protein CL617_04425 [archaeon]|nr:hypothetical protein [archaeon]|tara:strand:- start:16907 stop:17767 length:861 start_codon:yes stop_codon:yes gene_type:complete